MHPTILKYYICSLCLAPAEWEKMQERKWGRGDDVSKAEQLLTVLLSHLDLFPDVASGKSKKTKKASLQVDSSKRGLFNLLLSATT